MNALLEAAPEVCAFMQERRWSSCIIGGLAVQRWGDYRGPPRPVDGLVEMQRLFMKAAGRLREDPAAYAVGPRPPRGCVELAGTKAWYAGDARLLDFRKAALFCSSRCPGIVLSETHDLAQSLRAAGVAVISGFHSPMERECLAILSRSENPVIWCLARGLMKRVPPDLRPPLDAGRLLLLSPFPETVSRATVETATVRNRLVAALADLVVIAFAGAGSRLEALGIELLAAGKPVHTLDHPANALAGAGARLLRPKADWAALLREPGGDPEGPRAP